MDGKKMVSMAEDRPQIADAVLYGRYRTHVRRPIAVLVVKSLWPRPGTGDIFRDNVNSYMSPLPTVSLLFRSSLSPWTRPTRVNRTETIGRRNQAVRWNRQGHSLSPPCCGCRPGSRSGPWRFDGCYERERRRRRRRRRRCWDRRQQRQEGQRLGLPQRRLRQCVLLVPDQLQSLRDGQGRDSAPEGLPAGRPWRAGGRGGRGSGGGDAAQAEAPAWVSSGREGVFWRCLVSACLFRGGAC